jgi:hypothetical protein
MPITTQQHRRRERLAQRRLGDLLPVATKMKQRARRVGTHRTHVVEHADDEQLMVRLRCTFVIGIRVGLFPDAYALNAKFDRVPDALRNRLTVIEARFSAGDTKRAGSARRQKPIPGNLLCATLELEERPGAKLGYANEHTARRPQPEIRPRDGLQSARPLDASGNDGARQAEGPQLGLGQSLETWRGDREARELVGPLSSSDRYTHARVSGREDNNVSRLTAVVVTLGTAIVAGCSSTAPSLDPETARTASYVGAEVELVADGGLGGFTTRSLVRGSGPAFLYTMHRICSVSGCQAAIDSAAGGVRIGAADSLFAVVDREDPFSLKDDYGITVGAADMFSYTMRVTIGGRTKTVHADDGTMPAPMRRISEALRATIAAARR